MQSFFLLVTICSVATATSITQTSTQNFGSNLPINGFVYQYNNGTYTPPAFYQDAPSAVYFTLNFTDVQVSPNREVSAASLDLIGLLPTSQGLASNNHINNGFTYTQAHYTCFFYCYYYYTQETGTGGDASFFEQDYVYFYSIQTASHSMGISDYGSTGGLPSTYDLILNGFGPSLEAGETISVSGFLRRDVSYQILHRAFYGYSYDYFSTSGNLMGTGLLSVSSDETVPEPATFLCLGAGLVWVWRRRQM